jgi:hypothetical protein
MLADEAVGPILDGAIIATSHASHYQVGMPLLQEGISRRQRHAEGRENTAHRVINILMEKPMTTDVIEARKLWAMSNLHYPEGEHTLRNIELNITCTILMFILTFGARNLTRCIHY